MVRGALSRQAASSTRSFGSPGGWFDHVREATEALALGTEGVIVAPPDPRCVTRPATYGTVAPRLSLLSSHPNA